MIGLIQNATEFHTLFRILKILMHYLDVFSTPLVEVKGKNREADNCQPRVQIMKDFNEGLISLEKKRKNI